MKTECFLVFNRNGVLRSTKSRPSIKSGEFAVLVRLDIPDRIFAPVRLPDVLIELPEPAILAPPVVTIEPVALP